MMGGFYPAGEVVPLLALSGAQSCGGRDAAQCTGGDGWPLVE